MLECLDWKQLEQLVKTTFKRCAGAGPCGCFAVRASRSPNLIAHPLATFATRKLLTTFVGGPDRYAAGASRDRRISTPAFFCGDIIRRRARAGSPVRYAVRHLILTPLCASVPLCLCVNFITETQRHRVFFILLCPSAPLPLCVKINSRF